MPLPTHETNDEEATLGAASSSMDEPGQSPATVPSSGATCSGEESVHVAEQEDVKVLLWNVNRQKKKKRDEMTRFMKDYKILALTETPDHQYTTELSPEYTVIAKSNQNQKNCDLLFAFKKDLPYKFSQIKNKSDFILCVRAEPNDQNVNRQMILAVVYRPPTNLTTDDDVITIMHREYNKLSALYQSANFIILGDFNALTYNIEDCEEKKMQEIPERKFSEKKEEKLDGRNEEFGEQLLSFCKEEDFCIVNGRQGSDSGLRTTCPQPESTGESTHVYDYVLCRAKDWGIIVGLKVIKSNEPDEELSNHYPLAFTLKTELFNLENHFFKCCHVKKDCLKTKLQGDTSEVDVFVILNPYSEVEPLESLYTSHQVEFIDEERVQGLEIQNIPQLERENCKLFSVADKSELVVKILCFVFDISASQQDAHFPMREVYKMYESCFKEFPDSTFILWRLTSYDHSNDTEEDSTREHDGLQYQHNILKRCNVNEDSLYISCIQVAPVPVSEHTHSDGTPTLAIKDFFKDNYVEQTSNMGELLVNGTAKWKFQQVRIFPAGFAKVLGTNAPIYFSMQCLKKAHIQNISRKHCQDEQTFIYLAQQSEPSCVKQILCFYLNLTSNNPDISEVLKNFLQLCASCFKEYPVSKLTFWSFTRQEASECSDTELLECLQKLCHDEESYMYSCTIKKDATTEDSVLTFCIQAEVECTGTSSESQNHGD